MATTSIDIDVRAPAAWAVVADPTTYPRWLVGAQEILHVDAAFPAPGTSFRHRVGVGPLHLRDVSTVLESHPEHHQLVMRVRARPLIGAARVEMTVLASGVGISRVTIDETPRSIPLGPLLRPLADRAILARNRRSLANLARLLEAGDLVVDATPDPERATGGITPSRPTHATA